MKRKTTTATPAPGTMHLPPGLLAAASSDPTREAICGIHIDPEHRCLVATNGRLLARITIPDSITGEVKPGFITPDVWRVAKARKAKPSDPLVYDPIAGTLCGETIPEGTCDYPNYRKVIPVSEPVLRVSLDAVLIATLASAMAPTPGGITLEFAAGDEEAVRFYHATQEGKDSPPRILADGVLMPMRPITAGRSGLLAAGHHPDDLKELATLREAHEQMTAKLIAAQAATYSAARTAAPPPHGLAHSPQPSAPPHTPPPAL